VEAEDDEFGPPQSVPSVAVSPEDVLNRLHTNYLQQIGELQNSRAISDAHYQQAEMRIRELESEVAVLEKLYEEATGGESQEG
jgi:hypothetical protein